MASKYTSLRKGIKKKDWSWRTLCLDTWFPEIVATLFSIACFIAICGVLIAYDQESRPELYYDLSLNAIISVLATGCKSSLIFVIGEAMGQLKWVWFYAKPKRLLDIQTLDSASRGPLGSIGSLFRRTRRSLASLGAAVIILLLAFDPFIQQIIKYPTRLTAIHGSTSVATAKRLNYFAPAIDYNSVYSTGLWSEDVMLSPSCSSGECTWQKFQSTGICSQCSDITKSMDLTCEIIWDESIFSKVALQIDRTVNATCHVAPPQGNSTQFDLQFQSSSSAFASYFTRGISWHVFSAYNTRNVYVKHSQAKDQPFTWPGDPLMVVAYAEIGYNEDYLDSDLIGGIRIDKATECSLELCLLEYEMSVENGTPDITPSVLDYGQLFWRNTSSPQVALNQTLCWKPTTSPPDITFDDPINDTAVQLGPVEFAFCGISYEIKLHENVFVGSMRQDHAQLPDGSVFVGKPDGDPNTIRIGHVGLEKVMSNAAKYMTKEALRRNGSDVSGIVYATEMFVEVHWLWLILPTILVVSGTIFIAMVICENNKNGTSLWKSSVLAFFYHGLHEVDKDESMAASVMERKAKELVVRLQASEDHQGLILQEQKNLV